MQPIIRVNLYDKTIIGYSQPFLEHFENRVSFSTKDSFWRNFFEKRHCTSDWSSEMSTNRNWSGSAQLTTIANNIEDLNWEYRKPTLNEIPINIHKKKQKPPMKNENVRNESAVFFTTLSWSNMNLIRFQQCFYSFWREIINRV